MPPGIVTVLRPRSPAATKSPCCWTRRLTVRDPEGAGLALTVKEAVPPSVTEDVPVMLTVVEGGGVKVPTWKTGEMASKR